MGPLSRPLARSGQWSQTTTGISQPAARLSDIREGAERRNIQMKYLQREDPSRSFASLVPTSSSPAGGSDFLLVPKILSPFRFYVIQSAQHTQLGPHPLLPLRQTLPEGE